MGLFSSVIKAVAGPIVGGLFGKEGQSEANSANAAAAQKQMDFQERMSNTSYQRGMKDMRLAGLNPMLAFMKGGASVPDGARYEAGNEMATLADGLSHVNINQNEMLEASTAKTVADAEKSKAEADLATAQAAEARARTETYGPSIELTKQQIEEIKEKIPQIASSTDLNRTQAAKLAAEINNVARQGRLLDAQSERELAQAGLTRAQINEVVPRINKLIAETAYTEAGTDFQRFKSDIGNMVRVPEADKLLNSAGSALGEAAGAVRQFFEPDSRRRLRKPSSSR